MEGIELDNVPNQVGNGVMRLGDSSIVKCVGQMQAGQMKTLQRILKDTIKATVNDPFKKITVQFDNQSFIVTTDGTYLYAVVIESK